VGAFKDYFKMVGWGDQPIHPLLTPVKIQGEYALRAFADNKSHKKRVATELVKFMPVNLLFLRVVRKKILKNSLVFCFSYIYKYMI
jgi:hypothetical protein